MDERFVLQRLAGKRVLLLQGPVGPFFLRLSRALRGVGATVFKVNFNGGDWAFYPRGAMRYVGCMEDWPQELESIVRSLDIQAVMLFGDCRPVHVSAQRLSALGVQVWVFEEGYIRPDFVTLEPHGVNDRSQLSRDPAFYRHTAHMPSPRVRAMGNTFWWAAGWATLYYLAAFLLAPLFRRDLHHRPLRLRECVPWLIGAYRKWKYKWRERHVERRMSSLLSKRYFLVPLQVNVDSQVVVHSRFASIPEFIETVVASFARCAKEDEALVFKHHPMDRGYHDYSGLIEALTEKHRLHGRLLYVHDQHLPTLLAHARGAVVINSTVGLSALHHGTPLMAVGSALYQMPGLTAQCTLDDFWSQPEVWAADRELYAAYVCTLIAATQLNGSFYRPSLFAPSHRASSLEPTPELGMEPDGAE